MIKLHNDSIISATLDKKGVVLPFYYDNFDQNRLYYLYIQYKIGNRGLTSLSIACWCRAMVRKNGAKS